MILREYFNNVQGSMRKKYAEQYFIFALLIYTLTCSSATAEFVPFVIPARPDANSPIAVTSYEPILASGDRLQADGGHFYRDFLSATEESIATGHFEAGRLRQSLSSACIHCSLLMIGSCQLSFSFDDLLDSMPHMKILHGLEFLLGSVAVYIERASYYCRKSVLASILA